MDSWVAGVLPFGEALSLRFTGVPSLGEAVIATTALLFFFLFNLLGVKFYGWLQTVMVIVKCLAIVVLVVPGLFRDSMDQLFAAVSQRLLGHDHP